MAAALKKLSFFGSMFQFLNKKEDNHVQSARTAKINSYEDEIKLLLDAAELALPACVSDGIVLAIANSDAIKPVKKLIKHLGEIEKDTSYRSEKGALVIRISETEISVGGKINIPIFPVGQDYTQSPSPSQYAWKGTLNPDTLVVAVENFTKQKVDQGMLFYEQSKKLGRIFFDFKDLPPGITYVTPEDNVMLKRELSGVLIQFTFGRNLFWYNWDKQHQTALSENNSAVSTPASKTTSGITNFKLKEKEDIYQRLESNAKRLESVQKRTRRVGAKNSPKKIVTGPIPAPPAPVSDDAMLVDSMGAPIPPPPPPPPGGLKRKREDGDIPPPPPGMSPMGSAAKKRKLRQLNWSAIPRNKIEATFWKEAGSPSKVSGFMIDESEIEDLFSLSPKTDRKNPHMDPTRSSSSKKILISLLSLKRANNSGILLSQFKMSHREIRDAIAHMNDEFFTPEQLVSLKYLFPLSDTEKRAFQTFRGDPEQLASTDRFYWEMNDVQDPELKVNLMVFKQQFRGNLDDILATAKVLSSASEQLQTNKKFAQIMQVILKLGTVLNRSTIGGATAQGFRLETLAKLSDTKAKNGKTTALDYVAQMINSQMSHVLDFDTEMTDVFPASKIVLDVVTANMKEIGATLKCLERELAKYKAATPVTQQDKENSGPNSVGVNKQIDRFVQVMGPFYDESSKHYVEAERIFTQSVHSFNNCVHFFGDEPKNTNPELFFSVVAKFSEDLKKSSKLVAAQAEKAKKEAEAQSTPKMTRSIQLEVMTPETPAQ